jgi:hypothetical protein
MSYCILIAIILFLSEILWKQFMYWKIYYKNFSSFYFFFFGKTKFSTIGKMKNNAV